MNLKGQWFQLPEDKKAEAKAAAAMERVGISEWIADAVIQKLNKTKSRNTEKS